MIIANGKIIEATESEMFSQYLSRGYDELFSFNQYCDICKLHGTKIKKAKKNINKIIVR